MGGLCFPLSDLPLPPLCPSSTPLSLPSPPLSTDEEVHCWTVCGLSGRASLWPPSRPERIPNQCGNASGTPHPPLSPLSLTQRTVTSQHTSGSLSAVQLWGWITLMNWTVFFYIYVQAFYPACEKSSIWYTGCLLFWCGILLCWSLFWRLK